jgi:hypothetical protein
MNSTAQGDTEKAAQRSRPAARAMVLSMLWDIGLPVIAYFAAQLTGMSTYASLLVGTIVSALRMGWVAVRERRLDAFATFLLILFGTGFVLTFITGDVRFLLAKDSVTSGTAGVVFLVSCLINRPLAYYAAKRFAGHAGREEFLSTADTPIMRRRWYLVSLIWGAGLLTDAILRIVAAYTLPIGIAADVSQALMVATFTLLTIWSVRTAKHTTVAG